MLELERLARAAGRGTVGTVGEMELKPGLINVVPGQARFSLDIRGVDQESFTTVVRFIADFAPDAARRRQMTAEYVKRQELPATRLDERIVGALKAAARATGEPFMRMPSGAAHDTMSIAPLVPSAMVFVPCKEGISHSPLEEASPADGALAAEIMLGAIRSLFA
jgi:acetylornithine deacetylase/succinyl-diaminopimelate desuccinylase-like protein